MPMNGWPNVMRCCLWMIDDRMNLDTFRQFSVGRALARRVGLQADLQSYDSQKTTLLPLRTK